MRYKWSPHIFCLKLLPMVIFCCVSYADFPYIPQIDGELPQVLKSYMKTQLDVIKRQNEVPISEMHLRQRVANDEGQFLNTAHALGYFAATFSFDIQAETSPALLLMRPVAGAQYQFGALSVQVAGNSMPQEAWIKSLGIQEGEPAKSESIFVAEAKLLQSVRESGYPFPKVSKRDVAVNHANQRVNVIFKITPGAKATFGEINIEGLEHVKERVVMDSLPWNQGDDYRASLLDKAQKKLFALNLFGTVEIKAANAVGEDASLPINIVLHERKHRSVGAGINFTTDDGAGIELDWQHRNLQGRGRPLGLSFNYSQRIWGMEAKYKIDPFWRSDQKLILHGAVKTEDIDAYDAEYANFGATIERALGDSLTLHFGGGIHLDHVEQLDDIDDYQLLYGKAGFRFDRTDDPLDPTSGYRFSAALQPYIGFTSTPIFLKEDVEFSYYLRLNRENDVKEQDRPLVLATRLHLGSTYGESWRGIPADLRYYSGGGGALRGYPYRSVSAVIGNTPIGGESIYELSLELRKKVTEKIGLAFFVENGTAFNGSIANAFDESLWSVGFGGRYYSPIGPMRIDLAVPLDKRDGIDNIFQVYFSIGQAF